MTQSEWIAQRQRSIGASDTPAILGLSPWKSAFQVWAEKRGELEPDDLSDNEAVEFGIRLEQPIAQAYADRTGRQVAMWPARQIVYHMLHPWMSCTPDATQYDDIKGDGLLQIKTASAYKASDWQDGPPLMYQVQCQHEMAVTGNDWSTLVVLIGGQRLRYFDLDANYRFQEALIAKLESFWQLVQSGQPPEVDGSLATAKILAKLHPEDSGETVALPPEARDWTDVIETAREEIKQLEAVKLDAENHLKAAMGDATFGLLPDGSRWSWRTQNRKGYVVEPTTCRVLRRVK